MPAGPGPDGLCGPPPPSIPCFTAGNRAWHANNVISLQAERQVIVNQYTAELAAIDGQIAAAQQAHQNSINNACPM